ncbi:putative N-acetylated-alpha-linked acidic dipeptidase [Oratosquilla oratoria]|uniref:putative N-acetylated-alpha-linked acidic dipeptidase n=1 Tax=Oratosquilla oratoria TaxID=337810 RepID=UPI003F7708F6
MKVTWWTSRGIGACAVAALALGLALQLNLSLSPFDIPLADARIGCALGKEDSLCDRRESCSNYSWKRPSGDDDLFGDAGEEILYEMKAENIEKYLRYLTSQGHMAGTKQDLEQAEFLRKLWIEQGLDQAFLQPYNVQLSHPDPERPNKVYLMDENGKVKFTSSILEEPLHGHNYDESIPHGFLAFSPAGTIVTEELVYANYGLFSDFEELERLGLSPRGRVVIVRLGKVFRGDKVLNAERFGAAGVILYTDPSDYHPDAELGAPSYPKSIWLPGSGIQRGSILWHDGDPTTPNYPAIDGAYRLPENETDVPKIPVHVLSYNDARKLLAVMGGPKAPQDWQGRLNLTYNLGPQLAREGWSLKLEVNNVKRIVPTYNVIGMIRGSEEPDRYVIYGNHRDSWTFGSCDPSSATAIMMEMVRSYGQMLRKGWRPRRSIVFGSWGAGEYAFFGTTEWIEEYLKVFEARAVAHLNVDLAVIYAYNILISATPMLHKVITEATKKIPAPDPSLGYKNLWDHWTSRVRAASPDLMDYNLGSISEHAPFYQKIGVPTSYMVWEINFEELDWSDYPLYHSTYEDFEMMKNHLDPDFSYHLALARLWALKGIGLADSLILPMDPEDEVVMHKKLLAQLEDKYGEVLKEKRISLRHLESVIGRFEDTAKNFNSRIADTEKISPLVARQLNDQLMQLEKCYIDSEGLPQRPHLKNAMFGPDSFNQYNGWLAPGLRDALWSATNCRGVTAQDTEEVPPGPCDKYWEEVRHQIASVTRVINSATLMIRDFWRL